MTEQEVRNMLLKHAAKHKTKRIGSTGIPGWAARHSLAKSHISEFLHGKRSPSTAILEALGLEWRIMRKSKPEGEKDHD